MEKKISIRQQNIFLQDRLNDLIAAIQYRMASSYDQTIIFLQKKAEAKDEAEYMQAHRIASQYREVWVSFYTIYQCDYLGRTTEQALEDEMYTSFCDLFFK